MLDIVIPFHQNHKMTRDCVDSILRHTLPRARLILVDNGSPQGPYSPLADNPDVEYVRLEENRGWAGGANTGLERATASYIVLMNNHMLVPPEWVTTMADVLDEKGEVGAVGPLQHKGLVVGPDGRMRVRTQCPERIAQVVKDYPLYTDALSFGEYAEMVRTRFRGQGILVNKLSFFCVMLKRQALQRVGFLDEQFQFGYDDDDYSYRLAKEGMKMAVALDTVLFHAGGATFSQIGENSEEILAKERDKYLAKHNLPPDWNEPPSDNLTTLSQPADVTSRHGT